LLTFEVAAQEYALGLNAVQEIIPLPETLALVPRAEAVVLGVTAFRDTLLPLLSLRALLGLEGGKGTDRRDKVIVVAVAGVLVGLVADRMRAIVSADPGLIDPTPSALAARTGGETKIKAIYRGEGGGRLISILAPEQLFREDVMRQLSDERRADLPPRDDSGHESGDEVRLLVFRLGKEEFAVPIAAVDEVALVPEQIARLPKTPRFLEGVINLRGQVLPVVDQRRRFGMSRFEGERQRQRLVVVRSERHRAGLIVDSVSEVLRISGAEVEPAPELTDEIAALVDGVINLATAGRMVLRLDPGELLSRAERRLLDTFDAAARPEPA
jgi:purine-binding chemotaxis protein CheW